MNRQLKIVFNEGPASCNKGALFDIYDVTFLTSQNYIDANAFEFDEYSCCCATIRVPKHSAAHTFAVKKGWQYKPTDCPITWDADNWLKNFHSADADYHALRCEVWENTCAIVRDEGYNLPDGNSVFIANDNRYSKFYATPFKPSFVKKAPPEITVGPDDCLDVAHEWVNFNVTANVTTLLY